MLYIYEQPETNKGNSGELLLRIYDTTTATLWECRGKIHNQKPTWEALVTVLIIIWYNHCHPMGMQRIKNIKKRGEKSKYSITTPQRPNGRIEWLLQR
jgi:hypothetical protein